MKLRIFAIAATVLALLCLLPLAVSAADDAEAEALIFRPGVADVYARTTFVDALGMLQEGDELQLLKDVTVNDRIEINQKNVTLNGMGHTITRSEEIDRYYVRIIGSGVPVIKNITFDGNGMAETGIFVDGTIPLLKNVTIKNCLEDGIVARNTMKHGKPMVLENVTISNCENGSVAISKGAMIELNGTNNLAGGTAEGAEGHSIYMIVDHPGLEAGERWNITIISDEYKEVVKSWLVKSNAGVSSQDDVYLPYSCWTNDKDVIDSAVVTVDGRLHFDFYSLNKDTVGENAVIELLRDVEIDTTIHLVFIGKPYTFDGNGHTISPSSKFTRNNKNLQFLIDLDRNFDTNQSAIDDQGNRRNLIMLKDLTLDNKGVAYGLNTWYTNIDISNVTILDSKTVGFSVYTSSNITAKNMTIEGSEMLGMLVKMGATFEGDNVRIAGTKLRGIDVHLGTLKLENSYVEAGNVGILGYGDNGDKVPNFTAAQWYNKNIYLPQGIQTIHWVSEKPTHDEDGNPIDPALIVEGNGNWGYATTRFPQYDAINNTITLNNTKVIGGTAIEVKQTNMEIKNSEIVATGAPAVYHNDITNARTTFGYAIALTLFDTRDANISARGEITVNNSCLSGQIGIREPNSYRMDAQNVEDFAAIELKDNCVFDTACPAHYLKHEHKTFVFVANDNNDTAVKYPYKLAPKVVEKSSAKKDVAQEVTTDTSGKSAETITQMNTLSDIFAQAIEESNKTLVVEEKVSTEHIPGSPDGKAAAEPAGDTVDKSTVAPRQIVDVAGMASSIANDANIITDEVKAEAAVRLGTTADNVEIKVQPGIDIEIVDVDEANNITVDIKPVYQLYANDEAIGEKTPMNFVGTSTMVSIPLPDEYADEGVTVYITHDKEDGTDPHPYEATVIKVNDILYAEFENPHGFSKFTMSLENPNGSAGDDTTEDDEIEEIPEETTTDFVTYLLMKLLMQRFDFTVVASEGGTVTTDHVGEIRYGQRITYTITPDEGYEIADVLINGESIGAVSEYTFKRFKKDQTIEAVFVALP